MAIVKIKPKKLPNISQQILNRIAVTMIWSNPSIPIFLYIQFGIISIFLINVSMLTNRWFDDVKLLIGLNPMIIYIQSTHLAFILAWWIFLHYTMGKYPYQWGPKFAANTPTQRWKYPKHGRKLYPYHYIRDRWSSYTFLKHLMITAAMVIEYTSNTHRDRSLSQSILSHLESDTRYKAVTT